MQNIFSEFDISFRCQLFNFALTINGFTHCSVNKLPRKNTAVALKKSNKEDLIVLAISPQNNMDSSNDKVLEELNTLNQKLETLESDTTKNTNTLLSRQLVGLKRSILSILRENFLCRLVYSSHFQTRKSKRTFAIWLQNLRCEDLNTCHWIKYEERATVKFCKRTDYEKLLRIH